MRAACDAVTRARYGDFPASLRSTAISAPGGSVSTSRMDPVKQTVRRYAMRSRDARGASVDSVAESMGKAMHASLAVCIMTVADAPLDRRFIRLGNDMPVACAVARVGASAPITTRIHEYPKRLIVLRNPARRHVS